MSGGSSNPKILARILKEVKALSTGAPEGIKLVPHDTFGEVVAEIEGPVDTPYEGGSFKVKLVLGEDYPSVPPKGYLITKIFHPNVSNSGDICVNTLKRDWKPSNSLSHVLQIVRCLLIVPFPESSLNDDAGKLFMESYEDFSKKAKLMTKIHAMSSTAAAASSAGAAATPELEIVDGVHAPAAQMDAAANAPAVVAAAPPAAAHGGALAESNAKPARAAAKKPAAAKKSKKKGLKRL